MRFSFMKQKVRFERNNSWLENLSDIQPFVSLIAPAVRSTFE
jgi:hypothetical protein